MQLQPGLLVSYSACPEATYQVFNVDDFSDCVPGGIGMAFDLLPEPQGRVLLEVGPKARLCAGSRRPAKR